MIDRRKFLKTTLVIGGSTLAGGSVLLSPTRKKLLSLAESQMQNRFYSHQEELMGTWVNISCYSNDAINARRAIAAAFSEIKCIDKLMSIHRKDSQVSTINKFSGKDHFIVDSRLNEVLSLAKKYSERSQGKYDVTILPIMRLFGFYQKAPSRLPSDREIAKALDNISYKNIEIESDSLNFKIGLHKEGAAIDLGSIGKGYAVDRAVKVLKEYGITSALVNAGGNIYALGAPEMDPDPRQKWTIGIRDPKKSGGVLKTISLRDQGIATSGIDQTFVQIGSQEIGHIFNAVTGKPAHNFASSTAIAENATIADILSTTSYILGPQESLVLFPEAQFEFYPA